MIPIFLVQILVFFELDIVLNDKIDTMVARIPFLILNHSGKAFFYISWTVFKLNQRVRAGKRRYLRPSISLVGMFG